MTRKKLLYKTMPFDMLKHQFTCNLQNIPGEGPLVPPFDWGVLHIPWFARGLVLLNLEIKP